MKFGRAPTTEIIFFKSLNFTYYDMQYIIIPRIIEAS